MILASFKEQVSINSLLTFLQYLTLLGRCFYANMIQKMIFIQLFNSALKHFNIFLTY